MYVFSLGSVSWKTQLEHWWKFILIKWLFWAVSLYPVCWSVIWYFGCICIVWTTYYEKNKLFTSNTDSILHIFINTTIILNFNILHCHTVMRQKRWQGGVRHSRPAHTSCQEKKTNQRPLGNVLLLIILLLIIKGLVNRDLSTMRSVAPPRHGVIVWCVSHCDTANSAVAAFLRGAVSDFKPQMGCEALKYQTLGDWGH